MIMANKDKDTIWAALLCLMPAGEVRAEKRSGAESSAETEIFSPSNQMGLTPASTRAFVSSSRQSRPHWR